MFKLNLYSLSPKMGNPPSLDLCSMDSTDTFYKNHLKKAVGEPLIQLTLI